MKKIISILISITMIVCCFTVYSGASAKYNAVWSLTANTNGKNYTSADTIPVKAGDTISVKLHLKNNYYTGPTSAHIFYSTSLFNSISSYSFDLEDDFGLSSRNMSYLVDWNELAKDVKDTGWPKYSDATKLNEFKKSHQFARLSMVSDTRLIASPVYAVDENLVTMTFKVKSTASNGTTGEIIIPIETMRTKSNPYGFLFCGIYTGSSFASQVLQYSDDQSFDCTKAVLKFKVGSSDLGDVNGDKKINSTDALMVLESSVGKRTLTSAQKKKADVDSNGSINSSDALLILRYAVGEIKSF